MTAPTLAAQKAPPPPRRSSGSFEVADASILDMSPGGARAVAPPTMDALSVDAYVVGRTAERDAAAAEVARYQPVVAEVQGRMAAVRRRVAQAQEQIATMRKERAGEEERFRRQTNARLEGVGEARKGYRKAMSEVARIGLEDAANFPPSLAAAERVTIERTGEAAAIRTREAALHEAALGSFDPKALQTGLGIAGAAVVLFLLLFFSPVIVRSCSSDTGTMAPVYNETPLPP
jgi:hypothetical protein